MSGTLTQYSDKQAPALAEICRLLQSEIDTALPKATSRIWHAMPVWFVGDVPVVGYKTSADRVTLLFWNGQSFSDPLLIAAGKFKAAQIRYAAASEVDTKKLRVWLKKARTMLWDIRTVRKSKKKNRVD